MASRLPYRPLLLAIVATGLLSCSTIRHKGKLVEYPETVSAEVKKARRYALVVGINQFADPKWNRLQHAKKDAESMGQALAEFDEVVALVEPGQLTAQNVLAQLDLLIAKAQLDQDTLVVYLSTHGTLAYGADGRLHRYVVMEDTQEQQIAQSSLAVSTLLARLESARAQRRALIMAFCHSGEGKSHFTPQLQAERSGLKASFFVDPIEQVSHATVVLAASAWGETAREDDALDHDVYTYFFLQGVAQGDRNLDGAVTITEAHDYARDRTYYFTQGRQRPGARITITGADPIVLRGQRRNQGLPEIHGSRPRLHGARLLVNGQDKGALPQTFVVQPGEHRVQLRRAGEETWLIDTQVQLERDQYVDLADLLPQTKILTPGLRTGGLVLLGAEQMLPQTWPQLELYSNLRHFPWRGAWLQLSLGGGLSQGSIRETDVAYQANLIQAGVGFGQQFRFGAFYWRAGGWLSTVMVLRHFEQQIAASDSATSGVVGLTTELSYLLWDHLELGCALRGGLLPLPRDGRWQPVAVVEGALVLGLPFHLQPF